MDNVIFHSLVWREGRYFVAKCLEIEVASQGRTKKEALENLKEALGLYLEGEKLTELPPNLFLKQPRLEAITL